MTKDDVDEITRLKSACVDAALKVERASVEQMKADWKLGDFLFKIQQESAAK